MRQFAAADENRILREYHEVPFTVALNRGDPVAYLLLPRLRGVCRIEYLPSHACYQDRPDPPDGSTRG